MAPRVVLLGDIGNRLNPLPGRVSMDRRTLGYSALVLLALIAVSVLLDRGLNEGLHLATAGTVPGTLPCPTGTLPGTIPGTTLPGTIPGTTLPATIPGTTLPCPPTGTLPPFVPPPFVPPFVPPFIPPFIPPFVPPPEDVAAAVTVLPQAILPQDLLNLTLELQLAQVGALPPPPAGTDSWWASRGRKH